MDSANNAIVYSRETAAAFAQQIESFKQQIDTYQQQYGAYYSQHPEEYTPEAQASLQTQLDEFAAQLTTYINQYNAYCTALTAQEAAQAQAAVPVQEIYAPQETQAPVQEYIPQEAAIPVQEAYAPQGAPAPVQEYIPQEAAIPVQEAYAPQYSSPAPAQYSAPTRDDISNRPASPTDSSLLTHTKPQPPSMHDVTGILLDDVPYDDSNRKRSNLDDIAAPVLERSRYDDSNRKRSNLDDIPDTTVQGFAYTGERANLGAQLDEIEAPKLEEPDFTVPQAVNPMKNIDEVAAPLLQDMNAEFKPTYVRKETEDERRAKEESKKASTRARTAMEAAPEINKEESLRMYRELKAEQNAQAASKGFKLIFIVAGLGIALALCIYFFFTKIEMKDDSSFLDKVGSFMPYFAGAVGLFSLLTILRLGFAKTLASLSYIVNIILMLISITLIANCANVKSIIAFYIGSLVLSIFLCVFLNTNEPIEKFFSRKDTDVRY